jgi:alkaline phosphatase D
MFAQFGIGADARFTFDSWNGYDASRRKLLGHIRDNGVENVVVLTGDIHMSWGNDLAPDPYDDALYDPATGAGAVAVEIITPSVTSANASGFGTLVDGTIRFLNPHVQFLEMDHRGYVILDIDSSRIRSEWNLVDGVDIDEGALFRRVRFEVRSGVPHLVETT